MEIKQIPIDQFVKNEWNPNVMSEDMEEHLLKEYARVGVLQPILARPHKGKYQIIDGEHRWKIGKKFGLKKMDAVIVEMDDATAKLTTINMGRIKGIDDPLKLAELLKDLNKTIDLEKLSATTNIKLDELQAYIDLSKLPNIGDFDMEDKPRLIECPHCGKEIDLATVKVKKDGKKKGKRKAKE